MYKYLREYIQNTEFKLTLLKGRVNITNYDKLLQIGNKEIILTSYDKKLIITGENLAINKLLDDELLITGEITKIEVLNG